MDNYGKIIKDNLARLYKNMPDHPEQLLPGRYQDGQLILKAFGSSCRIGSDRMGLRSTIKQKPVSSVY